MFMPRWRNVPFALSVLILCSRQSLQNHSTHTYALLQPDVLNALDSYDVMWQQLMSLASDVFLEQNDQTSGESLVPWVLLAVFQTATWQPVTVLERRLLSHGFKLELMYCELEDTFAYDDARANLEKLVLGADIANVFLFADSGDFVLDVMKLVSNVTAFKWTSFLNTAEWTVVSSSEDTFVKLTGQTEVAVDFVTLVYVTETYFFSVAQKSREASLHHVLKVRRGDNLSESTSLSESSGIQYEVTSGESSDPLAPVIMCPFVRGNLNLRKTALIYIESLKSSLDGLVLPVSILPEDEQDFLSRTHVGNGTVYSGYSIALLDTIASSMGFNYYMVYADDGGYYGSVLENGDVSGISGQLARREAALSTMPLSMTESRRTKIDFVPIPIALENVVIIYRLPVKNDHLDLTYLDIFQPEFCLILLGPLVVAGILGAIIHVISDSCTSPKPEVVTRDKFRLMTSFPDHICFHTERTYKVQSGLILRTSWAMFWFIISSAYSAYLVTTFTIKPPELALKTFKQLLDHPEFTVGMTAHDTALLTFLRTSNDKTLHQVWQKLYERNKTDSATFNSNTEFHLNRVLSGGYAFVTQTSLQFLSVETYSDVRVYPQKDFQEISQEYVAVPKNTFYAKDVRRVLLSLEESGILDKLKGLSMKKTVKNPDDSKISSTEAVTFHRIELPVYFAVAGVILAVVSLVAEMLLHRYKTRHRYDVTHTFP